MVSLALAGMRIFLEFRISGIFGIWDIFGISLGTDPCLPSKEWMVVKGKMIQLLSLPVSFPNVFFSAV